MKSDALLERFEAGLIDAPSFGHREHVEVACAMLDCHDFATACARYSSAIRAMAESVGAPEKFHTTITIAFLALIAERRAQAGHVDFDSFLAANPDLLDRSVLDRWYSRERLLSPAARTAFLLPDRVEEAA